MSPVYLVPGWAYPASAMTPLQEALNDCGFTEVMITSAEALPVTGPPALLIGWSLGGVQALRHALAHPACCRHCVLISSTPKFCCPPDHSFPGQPPGAVNVMLRGLPRNRRMVLENFFRKSAAPKRLTDEALNRRIDDIASTPTEALTEGLQILLDTDLRNQLQSAPFPVLALHGAEDQIIPSQVLTAWPDLMPDCETWLDAETGHELVLDQSARVARTITQAVENTR